MLILRIYLLTGLVVHKLVWELLKRKRKSVSLPAQGPQDSKVHLVKLIKVLVLLGIVAQTMLPDILPITSEPLPLRIAGALLYSIGLFLAIRSRTELGANWSDIETAHVVREHRVIANGPYRFIRHPIYVGDLLLLFGLELALNSFLVLGVLLLTPIVLRQAVKEEKQLEMALPGYRSYCTQTKRFIPFVV